MRNPLNWFRSKRELVFVLKQHRRWMKEDSETIRRLRKQLQDAGLDPDLDQKKGSK